VRNRRPMAVGATLKMSASSTALPGRWPRVNYFARNIPLPRAKSKSQHNELYLEFAASAVHARERAWGDEDRFQLSMLLTALRL